MIIAPLSICCCVSMSFCCVLLSFIPDSFSFLVCRISLFIFGLNRFCNTSTALWANIVVRFVPVTAISLCIVCFMELDVMMLVCCTFFFNTCTVFNQAAVRTTFFCKCVASACCRYRNCLIVMRITCQSLQINCINKVCRPHELVIIIALTAHELLILLVVCISRIVICLFEFITVAGMVKQFALT